MKRLRPAEWMMLALFAHGALRVLLRAGLPGFVAGTFNSFSRGRFIALALLIVAAIKLARAYLPVRGDVPERFSRPLAVSFAVCALPLVLSVWLAKWEAERLNWADALFLDRLDYSWQTVLWVGGVGAAGFLPWLFVARAVAVQQAFLPGAFLRDGVLTLLRAVREWLPVGIALPLYGWMDEVVGVPARDFDSLMRAIDTALFLGHNPAVEIQRIEWLPLSEWLAFSYAFYGVFFPLALGAVFLQRGVGALRESVTALCCMFAIGFSTYMFVPVKGPALSQPLELPVDLYVLAEVKSMMDVRRFTWDCFPSLHTAGSMLLSWVCFRHARPLFWVTLPMVVSTPLACVYLRYHYVIDVLAGAALALAVMWSTPRLRGVRVQGV